MENQYVNVKEFVELMSYKTANEYLKLGWVSDGSYTTCYDTSGISAAHQTRHYCLYWDKESEPVHPHKNENYIFGEVL